MQPGDRQRFSFITSFSPLWSLFFENSDFSNIGSSPCKASALLFVVSKVHQTVRNQPVSN
jgi:hypothetical protein